ncbi:MAG: DUF1538 domain-containing protein [Planctomycetes bacterium]|nr:DUF1538 domain-containing protein [Planctomycetota bacterium]
MYHNFVEKIKESAISVVPVMLFVVFLHFTVSPLPSGELPQFLIGGVLLIIGLGIFLIGAEIGMLPFGQRVGAALTKRRNLPLILIASFVIGFVITIAEPDVQVLADQVTEITPGISKLMLLIMIAFGVGFFLVIGMLRVILQLSLSTLLLVFYILVFIACAFSDPIFVGIAFDSGGATTGPITVPFILAMGLGVASAIKPTKSGGHDNSFGFVGLASIGPIAAVAIMGIFFPVALTSPEEGIAAIVPASLFGSFLDKLPHVTYEISLALTPLLVIFLVFQFVVLHLPGQQVKRMLMGLFYTFIGLIIFLVGVNGGFTPVGKSLGMELGAMGEGWVLLPVGFVLGAVVVCAEPAVWVLNAQIEEVSGGAIQRRYMLIALSISIALAVMLGMLRVVTGLPIWYIVIPGYLIALILPRFCPSLFTAIAFDSGGVASGPMSTTFVLALTLGSSKAVGGDPAVDAFGMVAMIALAPLIAIQLLGMLFRYMEGKK